MRFLDVSLFAALIGMALAAPVQAQEDRKSLLRSCIEEAKRAYQANTATEIKASGGVTCPAGDIVGFPPRARTHNRNGTITLSAGEGRVICEGRIPEMQDVSANGGTRGDYAFGPDRSSVSVPVSCKGASPGNGRRWYNATLVAQSCVTLNEEIVLDLTLDCAAKLN